MSDAAEDLWNLTGFQPALIPANDADRVAALHRVGLLDSPPSDSFDQVTRLAARALGVPTTSEPLLSLSSGAIDSDNIERRYQRKNGGHVWTFLSVALKRTRQGEPDYFIVMVEDITEREKFEFELLESRESLSLEVARQTKKLQESNVALLTHEKKLLDAERRSHRTGQRLQSMADRLPVFLGYWNRGLVCEFANERYAGFFTLVSDVTTARNVQLAPEAANATLSNSNVTDYLTGIANRVHFAARGAEAASAFSVNGTVYGVILVDVAARMTGGEFALLCFGDLDADLLCLAAEKIRRQVEDEVHPGNVRITASCGVALSSGGDGDFGTDRSRAELALGDAKTGGGNRLVMVET